MAVFAPIPSASVAMATTVNAAFFRRVRTANRISSQSASSMFCIREPARQSSHFWAVARLAMKDSTPSDGRMG